MIRIIIASLLFAASLCADCFAVSVCSSVTLKKIEWKAVSLIALVFGIVQASFLVIGYEFGDFFIGYVEKIAHWIGFLLLLYVGASMIKEGVSGDEEAHDLNGLSHIVLAAAATSIDALAVGISLSMERDSVDDMVMKAAAVFLVTVISVVAGMYCGHRIGHKLGKIAEIAGGTVLILIGVNILLGLF